MKSRIMYMERKAGALVGSARIGRVTFNRTGRTIFYGEQVFRRIVGGGFKSNYHDEATGEDYWISGPKQRGGDRLYNSAAPVEIDADAREEYWCKIRNEPDRVNAEIA
ncbi:MAG: hypothetical protein QM796_17910 [Chthoniobacteraceae bacterium]